METIKAAEGMGLIVLRNSWISDVSEWHDILETNDLKDISFVKINMATVFEVVRVFCIGRDG